MRRSVRRQAGHPGHETPAARIPTGDAAPARAGWRIDVVGIAIVLVAFAARLHLATTAPYIHDEENTAIPLSQSISFTPGAVHLPIRGENHPALPAYVVKASGSLFGTTPVGYRLLHVLLGLFAVGLVYALAAALGGRVAGRWAAALLAFNEYFLSISSRATAHVPHLLLATVALFAFCRFLVAERVAYLYVTAAAIGMAFYAKEHSVLLVPVFAAMLLHPRYRRWWRSRHVYLAGALFALVLMPDVVWNLTRGPEMVYIAYGDVEPGTVAQATYGSHLGRVGGLGFSPYPSVFYAHDAVMALHQSLTGRPLIDQTPEYRAMNSGLGALLVAAVLAATIRRSTRADAARLCLAALFWGVFGFFTLIRPGSPPGRLDPVSWVWVEVTLLPAVVLSGVYLAEARGWTRAGTWALAGAALAYGAVWLVR